jgi:hypothetical protein
VCYAALHPRTIERAALGPKMAPKRGKTAVDRGLPHKERWDIALLLKCYKKGLRISLTRDAHHRSITDLACLREPAKDTPF